MNRHQDSDYIALEVARKNARLLLLVDRLCWVISAPAFAYFIVIVARQC